MFSGSQYRERLRWVCHRLCFRVDGRIAERKVVAGMTKEQAYDVVGDPLDIQSQEVNGVKVETWHPRQDRGRALRARRGAYDGHGPTGFPAQLKFVDGKLQVIG
jgi:hypothetical protein